MVSMSWHFGMLHRACGRLRSLKLCGCSATTKRALAAIMQSASTLEHLSLVNSCAAESTKISGDGLTSAIALALVSAGTQVNQCSGKIFP